MSTNGLRNIPLLDEASLSEHVQTAIAALERALAASPLQAGREAEAAEHLVVELRDNLITRLHQDPSDEKAPQWHVALEKINVSLSLIAGIVYPSSGLRRNIIEQARDVLKGIVF